MVESAAITAVEQLGIEHRVVQTRPATSAEESAELQGIELGALLRTLVVRRGDDDYLFVLVPGGRRFDWPKLRAHLGVKRMTMPDAEEAARRDRVRARRDHALRRHARASRCSSTPRRSSGRWWRSAAACAASTCTSRRVTWWHLGPRSSTCR